LTTCKNNKEVVQDLDLKGLYKQTVRKKWQKISGQPYQCKILDVQLSDTASSHLEPMFRPLVGSGRGDEDESGRRRHWRSR
jgi:hypothetical protein